MHTVIMKLLSIFAVITFSLFFFTKSVEAKVLPQAAKNGQKQIVAKKSSGGTGIGVSPKVRSDKRAVNVYFSNLQNATAVSYLLRYETNGQEEGAMGGINLTGSATASQELLFGTCSKNICRYHSGIKNARLEVSYASKTGKKYLRKYRIKI